MGSKAKSKKRLNSEKAENTVPSADSTLKVSENQKAKNAALKIKTQKAGSPTAKKLSGDQMSKALNNYSDQTLPEIPELDEILELPKNIREEAFVRAVCTAHKAKQKASKKVKQTLAWLHTESEN